jgi:hypothetical protein
MTGRYEMIRSIGLLAGATAFCLVLLANSSTAQAGGNCQTKLVGKSYTCIEEDSVDTTETFGAEFETGGVSSDFDLYYGAADYGCTCETNGSFSSPSFDDNGTKFECVGDGNYWEVTGTVKGKKLSIQGSYILGNSAITSCKED